MQPTEAYYKIQNIVMFKCERSYLPLNRQPYQEAVVPAACLNNLKTEKKKTWILNPLSISGINQEGFVMAVTSQVKEANIDKAFNNA